MLAARCCATCRFTVPIFPLPVRERREVPEMLSTRMHLQRTSHRQTVAHARALPVAAPKPQFGFTSIPFLTAPFEGNPLLITLPRNSTARPPHAHGRGQAFPAPARAAYAMRSQSVFPRGGNAWPPARLCWPGYPTGSLLHAGSPLHQHTHTARSAGANPPRPAGGRPSNCLVGSGGCGPAAKRPRCTLPARRPHAPHSSPRFY